MDRLIAVLGYGAVALSLLYVGRKFAEFAASYALLSHQIAQALAVLAVMTSKKLEQDTANATLRLVPREIDRRNP